MFHQRCSGSAGGGNHRGCRWTPLIYSHDQPSLSNQRACTRPRYVCRVVCLMIGILADDATYKRLMERFRSEHDNTFPEDTQNYPMSESSWAGEPFFFQCADQSVLPLLYFYYSSIRKLRLTGRGLLVWERNEANKKRPGTRSKYQSDIIFIAPLRTAREGSQPISKWIGRRQRTGTVSASWECIYTFVHDSKWDR